MKSILFPTDFSDHANIGLRYAVELCNEIDAELHIIAVYRIQRSASSFISMRDIIQKNTEEDMNRLVSGISQFIKNDKTPETLVIEGDTSDVIISYAKRHDIDLIIMGTQGANSLKTILFGSVTKKVANSTNIPLLAVPMSVAQASIDKGRFVLAVDDQEVAESAGFDLISDILDRMDKKLDILHVTKKSDRDVFPYDPFIGNYLGDQMGEVIILEGDNPVEAIKSYVETNDVSLLVMIKREHSFIERLLFKGNTAQEILITNVPLLIMPE